MARYPDLLLDTTKLSIHNRIAFDRDKSYVSTLMDWASVTKYREYYDGKHSVTLSDKQKTILRNLISNEFCDNICEQIVLEAAGRISFLGWECKNEEVKNWLDEFFKVAAVSSKQNESHKNAFRDGNFALCANWDINTESVRLYEEEWWDGTQGLYIHYDENGDVDYAVKEWCYDEFENNQTISVKRRIIWFPDRIEKWESISASDINGWEPAPLSSEKDLNNEFIWPIPWLDDKGAPLGVPYIHFYNGVKKKFNYGKSELSGGLLGFQDQINDIQYNISIAGRMTAAQQYFATGIKAPKDGTINVDAGSFHTSENEKSVFGVLPAGDINALVDAYKVKLKAAARMTRTPLHSIGGDWPSGEALLRAEFPAVSKARDQIDAFKDAWKNVATIAIKIYNTYSKKKKIDYSISKGIIETVFDDPEKRDVVSLSVVVHNLQGIISKAQGLRIMKYSEEQVTQIVDEYFEEESRSSEAMLGAMSKQGNSAYGSSSKEARGSGANNNPKNQKQ